MPDGEPLHDELLSDDDQYRSESWRRHILWQSAALAPNEAADLELNKAVQEVGLASRHFGAALPPRLRCIFPAYCAVSALATGAVAARAIWAMMNSEEVDGRMVQSMQAVWLCATCALWAELFLALLTWSREESSAVLFDRWFVLDAVVLVLTLLAWAAASQQQPGRFEAAAALLALRAALQPCRLAVPSANAVVGGAGGGVSVRNLRPVEPVSGAIAFDTDLGFDTSSCCSTSELHAERTLEARQERQDLGFESSSCCSSSELKAERALEAKQASEPNFNVADVERGYSEDYDIDSGSILAGEEDGHCRDCEANPVRGNVI